ncbi:cupin domain [Thiogranum longum]|uniref:Cupin domain n=1 Tax=Thiogranum longum TaxID=1537524 RepID=A0A4R1H7R6_9GAMM|nr:cupin domain-containing protein [Thiogranum longum]TCK17248.1 cupin domain [Thiogranum longum]
MQFNSARRTVPGIVARPDETKEYWFHEGCHILEISNRDDDPEASIARARVAPGVTTHWHSLRGVTERYLILKGRGEVEVGESGIQIMEAGDIILIPSGTRQRIRNCGNDDLIFYAICTPRFTSACYQDISEPDSG